MLRITTYRHNTRYDDCVLQDAKAKFNYAILLANQLASWSQTSCKPVCDHVRAMSTCRDNSNLPATGRKPGLRPARQVVAELLAGASEPARELVR